MPEGQPAAAMTAPYRMIPVSKWIHVPGWAPQVSNDRPLADGLSGWLDYRLEARSPLLIGGERREAAPVHIDFHKTPDGKFAIPGSTLRGMLRSVIEIAAFGRAAFIDDEMIRFRDLGRAVAADIYRGRMSGVRAGWLLPPDSLGEIRIQPCTWAKIQTKALAGHLELDPDPWATALSVEDRYGVLAKAAKSLAQCFHVQPGDGAMARPAAPGETSVPGLLVFTAKPTAGHAKKNEFFFHGEEADRRKWLAVGAAWKTFVDINSWDVGRARNDKQMLPGWSHWSSKHKLGERIPVFYLVAKDGGIDAIGTASMFPIAHALSRRDVLATINADHNDPRLLDLPALLFGPELGAGKNGIAAEARKGRVSVETAQWVSGKPKALGPVVLASPHGGFEPTMLRQPGANGKLDAFPYASYSPPAGAAGGLRKSPQSAGRKRYPARDEIEAHNVGSDDMRVMLHPLDGGAVFKGRVRFHNLLPAELGAIVWALELWAPGWGDRPVTQHKLGMGKPLGLGEVDAQITEARIEPNRLLSPKARPDGSTTLEAVRAYADCFTAHMTETFAAGKDENRSRGWRASDQVNLLLAYGDPKAVSPKLLPYMTLEQHGEARRTRLLLPDPPDWRPSEVTAEPAPAPEDPNFPQGSVWADAITKQRYSVRGPDPDDPDRVMASLANLGANAPEVSLAKSLLRAV
ncbi:MAG TPA: TIGR03986 family CRISPR-associated RAMP protein [Caulobacteraceae bacterium]|nr:TIGR03986 family CRISPR-associated RAMP protein [Caulobacteraceae bacterium]